MGGVGVIVGGFGLLFVTPIMTQFIAGDKFYNLDKRQG